MTEGLYDMYVNEAGAANRKLTRKQLAARTIGWFLYIAILYGLITSTLALVYGDWV
jgi:hypothetical protein